MVYTYLGSEGRLVLPLWVAEFDGLSIRGKTTTGTHFGSVVWALNPTYVKLAKGCLTLPSSVTEFNEVCIQF